MYRQGIPDISLFIEQDTEKTPESRKFYVIHGDQILGGYATLKAAIRRYAQAKEEMRYTPPQSVGTENVDLARVITEEWMSRTELHWSNSSSFRTTNKVRR